ncbi:MFS transporter [Chryseomicrobium aureum]|uniref:MFS transporter n=1 Tax=Chryseomicrobium aureum TaxID=1441723 RepID=UPI00370D48E1
MTTKSSLFKNRSFLSVWSGNAASELGGAFGTFCNSILVFQLTGSGLALGSMWILYYVPSLLLQFVIGPFIDRWSRKRIMIFSQLVRGTVFLVPLFLLYINELEVWHVYAVQLVIGLITPLYVPANQAITPTLVKEGELHQANAYLDGTARLMSFLAPVLAGVVIEFTSVQVTLYFVSGLLLSSGLLLLLVEERKQVGAIRASWWSEMKVGYRMFFQNPVLLWLGVFLGFVQFGVGVTLITTLPYITTELNGSYADYGYFMAGFPVGYILGAVLVPKIKMKGLGLMIGSLFIGGLTFIALYFIDWLPLAILTEVVGGVAMAVFSIQNLTLFQKSISNSMLGKVASVRLLLIRTFMLAGIVVGGLLSELWGIRPLYLLIGIVICIVSVCGTVLPYFKFLRNFKAVDV